MMTKAALGTIAAAIWLGFAAITMALPAELVERGERSTALVDVDTAEGRAFGSAFCVSEKGIFVTDGHVVVPSTGKIKVVVRPGEKDQRVLTATVLGVDYEADLAVIQTDTPAQCAALSLGNSDTVIPTQELTAFGYPFGNMLALDKDTYPSVSVNSGKITALRKEKGELALIQVDALVNPGNSGGPVMDANGKVIGIIESGVPGAGLNFATPVARLKKMMQGPLVVMNPVMMDYAQRNKPQSFSIHIASLSGSVRAYDVTLTTTDPKGTSQSVSGKTSAGKCDLMLTPTIDTTPLKWNPFTDPPPALKFTLTLKDSQKLTTTQTGTIGFLNVPMSGEILGGIGRNGGAKQNPLEPLPADATETQIVGTAKADEFREMAAREQLSTGILYTTGESNGKKFIASMRLTHAKNAGEKASLVTAKQGYVVGGLIVDAGQFVSAFKVIFIRRKGTHLDPTDTYTSDWAGNASDSKQQQQLAGKGERVIGICGRRGVLMRAVGLVIEKSSDSSTTQPISDGAVKK